MKIITKSFSLFLFLFVLITAAGLGNFSIEKDKVALVSAQEVVTLQAGLVAYYRFNETDGSTVFDSSGKGNHGLLVNGASRFEENQQDKKLQLDGIDDYVEVANSDSLNFEKGDFAIAAWVRLEDISKQQGLPLVVKQDSNRVGYSLFVDNEGHLVLQGRDANSSVRYAEVSKFILLPKVWYFVVGVGDRVNGYRLYINGIEQATSRIGSLDNQKGSLSNSTPLILGGNLNTGNYTKGEIDNVRIYKFALKTSDITNIYNQEAKSFFASDSPNIILIMTDDQDVNSMSVMSKTQNLLVSQGINFINSFVDFPVCCPSRASMITGQAAHNHKILGLVPETDGGYGKFVPTENNTLPVWLQKAGYITAHIGKYLNGYGKETDPSHIPPGWNIWYGLVDNYTYRYYNYIINENGKLVTYGDKESDYQTDVLAQKAIDFIFNQKESPRPFFLQITPVAPHAAIFSYSGDSPEPAPRHRGIFKNLSLPQPPSFNEEDVSDKPQFIQAHPSLSAEAVDRLTKHFRNRRESLLAVDDLVEKVINALRQTNKLDNTVIIYTSDNGYFQGEHRRPGNKYLAYEESIRVPLIIRGPNIPKNETRSQMVSNLDVAATIVEMAKAIPERILDGHSLSSLFKNSSVPLWRTALLVQGADQDGSNPKVFHGRYQAVRTSSYLYIDHPATNEEELYDLGKDPYQLTSEHNNSAYSQIKKKLKEILNSLRNCVGSTCWYTENLSNLSISSESSCPAGTTPVQLQTLPPQTSCLPIESKINNLSATSSKEAGVSGGFSSNSSQISLPSSKPLSPLPTSQEIPSPSFLASRNKLFSNVLRPGMRGKEVANLQTLLAKDKSIYPEGIITGYFGQLTKQAVIRFQEKYAADILIPNGLAKGTGIVGPATLKKLNEVFLEETFDY
ncbi:MAG: sulfatase-like hydrolase/transferase [Patescibacteria group bacterium]|nr:sulfatase-like hydrolase/transferase [Patescibacteria group bacterium]